MGKARAHVSASTNALTRAEIDSEQVTLVTQLLQRPIAYHQIFSQITNSVTAGVLLSQMWYWQGVKPKDEWFYKKQTEWESEIGLSRREYDTARKRLKSLKLIDEQLRGVPPTLYFRVNVREVVSAIFNLAESAKSICTNTPNQFGGKRQNITESTSESTSEKTTTSDLLVLEEPTPKPIVYPEITKVTKNETVRELSSAVWKYYLENFKTPAYKLTPARAKLVVEASQIALQMCPDRGSGTLLLDALDAMGRSSWHRENKAFDFETNFHRHLDRWLGEARA